MLACLLKKCFQRDTIVWNFPESLVSPMEQLGLVSPSVCSAVGENTLGALSCRERLYKHTCYAEDRGIFSSCPKT